ncbi:MAG: hypothetical protein JO112_21265 [Planctomycetes bacterium]|nr:hypothetical protein [Planctomycetota bacterium]
MIFRTPSLLSKAPGIRNPPGQAWGANRSRELSYRQRHRTLDLGYILDMESAASSPGPDLTTLLNLFPPTGDFPEYELVPVRDLPLPYYVMLAHEEHMTETVEAYYGDRVNVKVLARRLEGDTYARKILLTLQGNGRVVLFGIIRVQLQFTSPAVRAEIVAGKTPFGRILIQHDVLRRIEPTAYLRVVPNLAMMEWFGLAQPEILYGRLALIHCDEQPAVELLELVHCG